MPRTKIQACDGIAIEIWSATNAHIASIFNSAGTLKIDANTQLDFSFSGSIRASILSGGSFKTFDGLVTSATTGFFYLGAVAGTPSGVATTYSGLVPLVYDSTNDRLYVYNSSWKTIGGISSLNGLTNGTQTFSDVDDTNVTLTIGTSGGTIHTFTMGWASTLSIARGGSNASSFSATNGLVYYNGTSLVNSSNFLTNGTDVTIGGGAINSNIKLLVEKSGAATVAQYGLYVGHGSTSSTASIGKYGAYFDVYGDWTGGSAFSNGIYVAISLACPTVRGIDISSLGATTTGYGLKISSTHVSATTNYGVYISAASATTNYAIFVLNGISLFSEEVRTNGSLTTSSTSGFFYLGSVAGTPTAAPPTTYGGTVPMVYDSTNNKLYVYNGAWKSVTLA